MGKTTLEFPTINNQKVVKVPTRKGWYPQISRNSHLVKVA